MRAQSAKNSLKMDHAGYHAVVAAAATASTIANVHFPFFFRCSFFAAAVCHTRIGFALLCFTSCLLTLCVVSFPRFWCMPFWLLQKKKKYPNISVLICCCCDHCTFFLFAVVVVVIVTFWATKKMYTMSFVNVRNQATLDDACCYN